MLGGSLRLRDQFWWDLHATSPTPEEFAAELCADVGLDSCHGAAVAAAIRIEVGWHCGGRVSSNGGTTCLLHHPFRSVVLLPFSALNEP